MNHIQNAMKQAADIILAAYNTAAQNGELPQAEVKAPVIEIPKDLAHGDYASNFALQNTKIIGKAPKMIAEAIAKNAQLEGSYYESITILGPGFINFRLGQKWFTDVLTNINEEAENYGKLANENPQKIMVEFVSANPTGPMHMGNARGGVLGDSLANVLAWAGNDVTKEFYVNDAGNQIDKFANSINVRYMQILEGEEAHPLPEDAYHGEDIKVIAKELYDMHGDSLKNLDEKERFAKYVEYGLGKNIPKMKSDLARYGINYDVWFFESQLHNTGYVKETVDMLTANGFTYEQDGAVWLKSTAFGCEKDDVLMRGNGFYTYFAADIAYHREKFANRHFDKVINIWGADHHGHVARLKSALDALHLDGTNRLEIVLMQLVRLMRDGEVVRMSKRTGKSITLTDLLDEVSCDAARYFFNSRAADTHLEFDLGLAVRQDSENPVYYCQYAHARICSILANLEREGIAVNANPDLSLLTSKEELDLIREVAKLPEEIRLAANDREPARLNRYAINVASAFHKFYGVSRIKDAQPEVRDARVYAIKCAAAVIKNTLSILGVTAPEQM
ncbi:MAG: arginine--tRNA ligase [Clostridia bacterium]|nr:arginine--tRNA ligase [Clostridia bacterium]MBR5265865.1 arginine--tRNA ligase [Clostridia bacterium]